MRQHSGMRHRSITRSGQRVTTRPVLRVCGRSSMALYQQYAALYEKFKVLDDKYCALKKAMNEVLWEVSW